jgi:hypothetical protein
MKMNLYFRTIGTMKSKDLVIMKTDRKHTIVGLVAAIVVLAGLILEQSTPQKSTRHIQEGTAGTRELSADERRWKEYAERSNAEFHKHVVEFENDRFFSPEVEASFADMAKPRTPTYAQKGFDTH